MIRYKYVHDALDRMTAVKKDAGAILVEEYAYDQFNNRRTRHPNGGSTYFYKHDNAQQLNEICTGFDSGTITTSFQYDDSGNLTNKTEGSVTHILAYDALERLTQVAGSDISTETYDYDHQGRRIEKTVAGATNNLSAAQPMQPIAVTTIMGVTQASTRYDSWDNVIASGSIPQFGFTGREPDATGFIYFRARYYDPAMGRFIQRDPLGLAKMAVTAGGARVRVVQGTVAVVVVGRVVLRGPHPWVVC